MRRKRFYTFISYTRHAPEAAEIKRFIDRYLDRLRKAGYDIEAVSSVFYDQIYMHGPLTEEGIRSQLTEALGESSFMTAFLSPEYITAKWCVFEWETMLSIEMMRSPGNPSYPGDILAIWWKRSNYPEKFASRAALEAVDDRGRYPSEIGCVIEQALQRCVEGTIQYLERRA